MTATKDATSDLIRGNIDAIILCVLADGDSYGYEILKDIAARSQGEYEMKEPSLYTSLKRLERQGCIEGYWGNETQGARRKYYRVLPLGMSELAQATERWAHVRDVIDRLLLRGEPSSSGDDHAASGAPASRRHRDQDMEQVMTKAGETDE